MSIGVLLIMNDPKSKRVVQKMQSCCMYRELYNGYVFPALRALWNVKDTMKFCLTNAQRLESVGSNFHRRFEEYFQLHILKMTPDNNIIQWKGDNTEAAAYILNDFSYKVIRQVWQQEMVDVNVVNQDILKLEMVERGVMDQEDYDTAKYFVDEEQVQMEEMGNGEQAVKDSEKCVENQVVKKDREEWGDNIEKIQVMKKKDCEEVIENAKRHGRIRWSTEMHQKFKDAVYLLGADRTFPKTILETMNVPGLTRAQVASHLQKHRNKSKKLSEEEEHKKQRLDAMNQGKFAVDGNSVFVDPLHQNQYPSTNSIFFQQQNLTDMDSIPIPRQQSSTQPSEDGSSFLVDPIQAVQHPLSSRIDDLDFGWLFNKMAKPYHNLFGDKNSYPDPNFGHGK